MSHPDGNFYDFTRTDAGIPTFKHVSTGETLHSQAGPYEEAWGLYVEPSGLLSRRGPAVVFDCGLGCATHVIACLECFKKNSAITSLCVVSFDLEKLGLSALLEHIHEFPFAQPYLSLIKKMLESNTVIEVFEDGRTFEWKFIAGDFEEAIKTRSSLPKANYVFYDFFSPLKRPRLWSFDVLQEVFHACADDGIFLTYSCATCIRACLAASGFFVGFGIPSGKKAKTTFAAKLPEHLQEPLPAKWKQTFFKSHLPFVSIETDENKSIISSRIATHPQFQTI